MRAPRATAAMGCGWSCGRGLAWLEDWVTGYRSEHYKIGLQMAAALTLGLLPILLNGIYYSLDKGGSTLYTAITVG